MTVVSLEFLEVIKNEILKKFSEDYEKLDLVFRFEFNLCKRTIGDINAVVGIDKPIAGFLTHQKYLDNLLTAVNNTSETLLVGQPITLKISATLKSSLARIDHIRD